jgi:hypothetical protein
MNVEIGTETLIFLFWEYLFLKFGILSLQCIAPLLQLRVLYPTYLRHKQVWIYVSRVTNTETLHLYLKGSVQYLIIQGPGDGWQGQTWTQVRNIKQDYITLQ